VTAPEPIATYRIQLTPDFGFAATVGVLDHLVRLGVSHLYLSPVAEAVPGSQHGYDVVDHRRIREELGGHDGLFALLDAAHDRGLGVIVDHVPNHTSVAAPHLNERWWTMLRDGPTSPAAAWFDVDWEGGDGRVVVPRLGDPIDDVLAAGGLEIAGGDDGPELRYGPLRFPMAPGTQDLPVAEAVARQHYRLAWWRDPVRNVRRFFTIDDLVAVRVEDPAVAEVVDTIPRLLCDHPAFAGVRVDHVDGLAQPAAYLRGLRSTIGDDRWLLVEKILAVGEWLPPSWPVDGTTGYEHIRTAEHALLDPAAEPILTGLWRDLTGDERPYEDLEECARREVIDGGMRPDLERVTRIAARELPGLDAPTVRDALVELTIGVHRYRTYLPDDEASAAELESAHDRAVAARPDLADAVAALVGLFERRPDVATRWEQVTSPVMAKGAEDRAFYRYLRLGALCEVGGAPGRFALPLADFHDHQRQVQATTPQSMLAGTTHDTKRSEGVRARGLALAADAEAWEHVVRDWFAVHGERYRAQGLDAATMLLALETAVTAWPIDADRLMEYLVKSAREAEEHTSWTEPDERYEATLARLARLLAHELVEDEVVEQVVEVALEATDEVPLDVAIDTPLTDPDDDVLAGARRGALAPMVARVIRPGWAMSLTGLAIRLTAPGVPDLYQGTAAFTYSLVDPDNRVEPDWDERRALVETAASLDGPAAWSGEAVEASTAVVIMRVLGLRRRRAAAFGARADYRPLDAQGERGDAVLAFARGDGAGAGVATVVSTRQVSDWGATTITLPDGAWRNVLDDGGPSFAGGTAVSVGDLLDRFPVAVLERT
jgi:(1->4)-alpha-D-glucan 1-alpha-D-glucosylmutase